MCCITYFTTANKHTIKNTHITMDLNFVFVVCLVDHCALQCEHGSLQNDTCTCTCQKHWTGDKCGMLVLFEKHLD